MKKKRDPKVTSKIMSSIKSKDTRPERVLGSLMWSAGLRYRKNFKDLPGKPDFVFIGKKIAVFCDGDFWHGHNWKLRGFQSLNDELKAYNDFWKKKILKNVARDLKVSEQLKKNGWRVLRFWESNIINNPQKCLDVIRKYYTKA